MKEVICQCGEKITAETGEGLLKKYDLHVYHKHPASPAQWTDAYEKIQEGKERAKKGNAAQGANVP
jgi:hypothetical protein